MLIQSSTTVHRASSPVQVCSAFCTVHNRRDAVQTPNNLDLVETDRTVFLCTQYEVVLVSYYSQCIRYHTVCAVALRAIESYCAAKIATLQSYRHPVKEDGALDRLA